MVMDCKMVSLHPEALETIKVTLYTPSLAYVCCGFCNDDVVPSPNCQAHVDMLPLPTVDTSFNCVALPTQTSGAVKSAVGNGFTVRLPVSESIQPKPEVATKVTGYVPTVGIATDGF